MKRSLMGFGLVLLLAGCANLGREGGSAAAPPVGIDGQACAGRAPQAVPGLSPSSQPVLQRQVQLPSGKGGVCDAQVFSVSEQPIKLYRVFDASKPYTKFGGWWSLERPSGSRDSYRAANAICPEWSPLDRLAVCEVHPGTQLVIGSTQSAGCADGSTFPKTAAQQVFVPNNGRIGIVHVGACTEEAIWAP